MAYYPAQAIGADVVLLPRGLYARTDDLPDTALRALRSNRLSRSVTWRRGSIQGFSSSSRRRLQRTLAAVDFTAAGASPVFLTLTFHVVPDDWHERWHAWMRILRRRRIHYIWRLEAQRRGAPHYHFILWASPGQLDELRAHWTRLAAPESEHHRRYGWHVVALPTWRKALAYTAKYVSKVEDAEDRELGGRRRWGTSRDLPTRALAWGAIAPSDLVQLKRLARRLRKSQFRRYKARPDAGRYSIWLWLSEPYARRWLDMQAIRLAPAEWLPDEAAALRLTGVAGIPPPIKSYTALCQSSSTSPAVPSIYRQGSLFAPPADDDVRHRVRPQIATWREGAFAVPLWPGTRALARWIAERTPDVEVNATGTCMLVRMTERAGVCWTQQLYQSLGHLGTPEELSPFYDAIRALDRAARYSAVPLPAAGVAGIPPPIKSSAALCQSSST